MDKSLHDEIMSAVDPNPKIVFSAKDSSNDDIISYGQKNFDDFVRFYNYGTNGKSMLEGKSSNNWITTPNPVENAFTLLLTHHSARLTNFQIHTGCNDDVKLAPSQFFLYGYNSHLKRWDVISDFQGEPLKMKSLYDFDVRNDNQKIFYRMFRFITHTGRTSLAYIKLYGDVISESDNPPEDVACKGSTIIKYKTIPSIICQNKEGFFRTATKIFGPNLQSFVFVTMESDESSFYDIWNTRNKPYRSCKSNKPIFICFYFPHHEVSITGYEIQPASKNSIKNWCIIGCENNDDEGVTLDHQTNCDLENEKSLYSWKINDELSAKKFRIIRFVGLDNSFSFNRLDFLGKAIPCPSKVLTEKEMTGTFTFSHSIQEWKQANK